MYLEDCYQRYCRSHSMIGCGCFCDSQRAERTPVADVRQHIIARTDGNAYW